MHLTADCFILYLLLSLACYCKQLWQEPPRPKFGFLPHKHSRMGSDADTLCLIAFIHPNAMLMITLSVDICNPVSQDFYDKTICNLQFHQLICTCGHSGCLTIHGYYDRTVKAGDCDLRLRVCRVICSECGHTHALLLSSIVPYSQVSLPDQVDIIQHAWSDADFSAVMDATPSIDESCVRSVIRRFRRHWEQRLLSESISLSLSTDFIRMCFSAFCRQFMRIKSTSNILFLTPT